ncbi:DnaB-like helicase C-terminal domain-containing protein [Akkermansia sp. N21116]|uniref:replicative DNA helicase n=1 Tax=Akkermansia sp. N21116 TaxID=3040764 RepID=UPI00244E8EFF|nr:DnaB-like helicase C-terminal domain-containing protein [Akkermansia sp. N21116]WPX40134.1 DnaB-like helicase C-terminal domain-containing protein [Akkermansia sp. N21116]
MNTSIILPNALIAAERTVLGVCLSNPVKISSLMLKGVSRAFFALPGHKAIWGALEDLSKTPEKCNAIELAKKMEAEGTIDDVGGIQGLTEIVSGYSYLYQFDDSLNVVIEAKKRRDAMDAINRLQEKAVDLSVDSDDLLAYIENELVGLRKTNKNASIRRIGDAAAKVIDDLEFRMAHPGAIRGLSTGFPSLDRTLDGLQDGAMIVVGARPGIGKTSFLVNILQHLTLLEPAINVGMISLEMPADQLLERVLFQISKINSAELRRGSKITQHQSQAFTRGLKVIKNAPFYIADKSAMTIGEIQAVARQMVNEHGIRCLGVDYLQLAKGMSKQGVGNREREVSEISAGLKAIAKELSIPVIVLAQLNRDVTKRDGKAAIPKVSDLRDSGSIEQDADQVLLLHRPSPDDKEADKTEASLIVGKNRFGLTGHIKLKWNAGLTQYMEA